MVVVPCILTFFERPPLFKDCLFSAQIWSLNAGFTELPALISASMLLYLKLTMCQHIFNLIDWIYISLSGLSKAQRHLCMYHLHYYCRWVQPSRLLDKRHAIHLELEMPHSVFSFAFILRPNMRALPVWNDWSHLKAALISGRLNCLPGIEWRLSVGLSWCQIHCILRTVLTLTSSVCSIVITTGLTKSRVWVGQSPVPHCMAVDTTPEASSVLQERYDQVLSYKLLHTS